MSQLSEDARQLLTETVREFQLSHAGELPKVDDAYRALYPDQVSLFDFRQTWNAALRERERAALKAAKDAELRAAIEAEVREEVATSEEVSTSKTQIPNNLQTPSPEGGEAASTET